jgi:hypothetical protein
VPHARTQERMPEVVLLVTLMVQTCRQTGNAPLAEFNGAFTPV